MIAKIKEIVERNMNKDQNAMEFIDNGNGLEVNISNTLYKELEEIEGKTVQECVQIYADFVIKKIIEENPPKEGEES